ncbi:hypothetical protein, partial [Holospora undulata]|uniref:hypothetical protein n=1 Tax=Holospora undulata TaxID=1169117 RepID=UPI000557C057
MKSPPEIIINVLIKDFSRSNVIMSLIKEEDLERLGKLYDVNRYNNKITGELLFKGLLRLILLGKKTRLRMLEKLINQGF